MMLRYEGSASFRCRVVTSILCSKSLRIDNIRVNDEHPGLQEAEASFLRLIEKLSDGNVSHIFSLLHRYLRVCYIQGVQSR
jgi:RNA 3'-terminal phosphate cyclase-like protein